MTIIYDNIVSWKYTFDSTEFELRWRSLIKVTVSVSSTTVNP